MTSTGICKKKVVIQNKWPKRSWYNNLSFEIKRLQYSSSKILQVNFRNKKKNYSLKCKHSFLLKKLIDFHRSFVFWLNMQPFVSIIKSMIKWSLKHLNHFSLKLSNLFQSESPMTIFEKVSEPYWCSNKFLSPFGFVLSFFIWVTVTQPLKWLLSRTNSQKVLDVLVLKKSFFFQIYYIIFQWL